ncbi:RimK family protein [Oceanicoccus sp. KOV_DT_Chl]|uniref:RimK family protein n=1 Tax=Oceanicoccus sp. KOV_DT_Chl TaxID=1904639 RepID=UPI000C7A5B7A|nr:RimK family protein [Oceanicoccus sp. KOV_DT_Chl]
MYKTLFVVDDETISLEQASLNAISFETYLRDYPKLNEPKIRVINLCNTERYLSQGYYCSLLAEARHHQALPSIKTINALRTFANKGDGLWLKGKELLVETDNTEIATVSHIMCMGEVIDSRYKKLANRVFQQYPAPLLKISFVAAASGVAVNLERCSLPELSQQEQAFCLEVLQKYSQLQWQKSSASKQYRWDMALLVNPEEAVPPSDKLAIARFIKAGEKLGIRVQTVTAADLLHINQFDALFIRETTAIDHHTYRLASEAEANGLVVLDDPDSILRCCNKVFLHDAFNYQKVPSLTTLFINDSSDATLDTLEQQLGYPVVLKMPEGSFSRGVYKAENREVLFQTLQDLLKDSALVLAQEFLRTDYDWRVGVLNGRAIYACRYYMARNHWQIYNHDSKRFFSGGFDTLPTFEVPKAVLNAALKSAAVVGNGLYGIDIKETDGKAYVLEVNDNPSIDCGVEDKYLGEELYMQIMSEFLRRLESRGR